MKSPKQLADKLARQWDNADTRQRRLLEPSQWPVDLAIGKPTAKQIKYNLDSVRQHVSLWRNMKTAKVIWDTIKYRDTMEAIELPTYWQLEKPSDWIEATGKIFVKQEYQKLCNIVSTVDSRFHPIFIRHRYLFTDKTEAEVIQACALALELEQGSANNFPLRALSIAGIDSKFFERHRRLLIKLLDLRFDGMVSEFGLETFLGATNENDQWLLLTDLDSSLLPFKQLKIRDSEFKSKALSAANILIIENEQCLHQLPQTAHTIAILGAGFNLSWMKASWLNNKNIAYWGDIDTWGLTMLAQARQHQPKLTALMMTQSIFEQHIEKAVFEPKTAGNKIPTELTPQESQLYTYLLNTKNGRLEQEFLAPEIVKTIIGRWVSRT